MELDVWLPELNKAIEYGAEYHHIEEDVVYRDNIKKQWCINNNIDILNIDDDLWRKDKVSQIDRLISFLEV